MPDSKQICDYRQCIYDQYLSKTVRHGGQPYSAKEYQRWADATKARLRGWLPADRHTPVLDLGCGQGNFLYLMAKLGYSNLTGVDLSGEQIEMARQWCPCATLIHGDVKQELAENPDKFGLITGFDLIEHFTKSEIMPFIKQIARALSTGGRLILQTPNAESPWGLGSDMVILLTRLRLLRIAWSTCCGCRGLPIFKAGSADLTPMESRA